MSTYRERREARAERLRGWAEKREEKAEAAEAGARALADMIPFGQPILLGHHSQRRAERDAARIRGGYEKSFEHADKARSMASRADNIESQLAGAIYSDDADAIPALEARIAGLEAERDRIKAYNASARKGTPDRSLLSDREYASLQSALQFSPVAARAKGAFPGYHLTNLSGNIARNRKRLDSLKAES